MGLDSQIALEDNGDVCRGCFFCKTGKELEVVQSFLRSFPSYHAVAPTRTRYRRTKDAATEERVPLLPGYVFFEAVADRKDRVLPEEPAGKRLEPLEASLRAFARSDSVLRLLRYSDGDWILHGADDQFARVLIRTGGNIGVSRAYFDEGNRIRILDGFLKDYEGDVVRVNRKTRTVEVSVDFQGKKVSMWLGYELVAALDGDNHNIKGSQLL